MGFEKEIGEMRAQGATEIEILADYLRAYEKDEIDFDGLMDRVGSLNGVFGTEYNVEGMNAVENENENEIADRLFGMESESETKNNESTMEGEENDAR